MPGLVERNLCNKAFHDPVERAPNIMQRLAGVAALSFEPFAERHKVFGRERSGLGVDFDNDPLDWWGEPNLGPKELMNPHPSCSPAPILLFAFRDI